MHDPIAYIYDAAYHCPDCAFERFGRDENGFVPADAEDREGNPIGSVNVWDEWWEPEDGTYPAQILACGTCGREMDRVQITESAWVDRMYDAFLECALWSTSDPDTNSDDDAANESAREAGHGDCLDDFYTADDLSEDAASSIREDCESFAYHNWDDLRDLDPEQVGHDFSLTRDHHGTGFWDRGLGERGERLTNAAHAYGPVELYPGDDGKLYVF